MNLLNNGSVNNNINATANQHLLKTAKLMQYFKTVSECSKRNNILIMRMTATNAVMTVQSQVEILMSQSICN